MMKKLIVVAALAGTLGAALISCQQLQKNNQTHSEKIATTPPPGTPPDVAPIVWETRQQHDARMQWWREARFGMFIHWGLYCTFAGEWHGKRDAHIGEWIMNDFKIPVAEYAENAKKFNPTKFNADQWVLAAKNAGMQYIVITAKHHEGFAMYHTHVDGYNIYDATPFHRDPLAELAAACRRHGMKLGFYYSQSQDWHHPGGTAMHGGHWDKAQDGSMDEYIRNVAVPQVRELLSHYGDVAVLWWDTPLDMTHDRAAQFLPLYSLQPPLITNNRLIHGDPKIPGDYETPEQRIPATGLPGRDWETCMTMNTTWGYKWFDQDWKSTQTLLHNLIDIASKGGNYLLNVGPTAQGVFPDASIQRLKEIGQWMKINGVAIHDTTASPFRHYSWNGRATVRGNTLFIHVFHWGDDKAVRIEGLRSKVQHAKILQGREHINGGEIPAPFKYDPDGTLIINRPEGLQTMESDIPAASVELPTVIELTLDGPPVVNN
ncbi:MAG TPA: alpha-L-fucosidase [Tepidisphaeraceae bacterium]|jgi:alpha-L-fucosidase